jgi:hypothetical protein
MRTRARELSALSSWTEAQPDRYQPAGRMPEWIKHALDEATDGANPARERWTTRYVFTGAI